jgi:RNA 3'-terminal phosphate cyclase (ATP)
MARADSLQPFDLTETRAEGGGLRRVSAPALPRTVAQRELGQLRRPGARTTNCAAAVRQNEGPGNALLGDCMGTSARSSPSSAKGVSAECVARAGARGETMMSDAALGPHLVDQWL